MKIPRPTEVCVDLLRRHSDSRNSRDGFSLYRNCFRAAFMLLFCGLVCAAGHALADPAASEFNTPPIVSGHVTVGLISSRASIQPRSSLDAGLYFKLEKGWHVYWINAGDAGEPPRVKWSLPPGLTADPIQFPAPRRLPLGTLMDFGYEDEVVFPLTLHADAALKPGVRLDPAAKVSWLVCRESCIPGKADLRLPLTVSPTPGAPVGAALIAHYQERLPRPLPPGARALFSQSASGFKLAVVGLDFASSAHFFPLDQNVISNPAPQPATSLAKGIELDLKRDENLAAPPHELHGLLVLSDGTGYEIHALPGVVLTSAAMGGGLTSLLKAAGLAFLGGILLNLMPCVFPVLFIKGLALVQSSGEERSRMRAHGWVYTIGILTSFWAVVAVLLILRAGGRQLGWGFQFQSPTFLALIALLLFFLGLSLAGMFEIGLTLTSVGSGLAARQGYSGSFFTGVLATVVASPCAAPFMGAGIGYALAHSAGVTFAIFTALALGLALPYLLLSFNPGWTRLLPRPGAWMEVLKQATAVPIFGTVIWMIWLFAMNAGDTALLGLLAGLLLLAIAAWVMGRWPARRLPSLIAALIVIAAVTAPLYALRRFAAGPAVAVAAPGAESAGWEPFSPALLAKYRAARRPVFVDFTASWCLSCQVNERVVLERADVRDRLRTSGIALVKADWTRHDDTIAQTLTSLGRSGVPTYVIYPGTADGQPDLLPEVLTPGILFAAIDHLGAAKPSAASSTAAVNSDVNQSPK